MNAPIVGAEHCCLCGIRLVDLKRRYQCHLENANFVRARCKSSPFLYRMLIRPTAHADSSQQPQGGDTRQGVCIPCVNWKRRVETYGLKRTKQPMLQLDQLICYLMQPGVHSEPDHRCMERLIKAARQHDNPYRCVFPVPVQTILDNIEENNFYACVKSWWAYNGHSEFFASGQEARRVRNVVKYYGDRQDT